MEKKAAGEYDACYADIFKHYQPVGWLEEHRVETIAVWSWRLRRMIRHESGQIARALAEHNYTLQQSRAADTEEPDAVPSSSPQMDAMTDHLFLTSEGLEEQMRYEAMINRQLNHAIHIAALGQISHDSPGRVYYLAKQADGKSRKEAMRCLKRRISDAVYRQLRADTPH